MATGRYLNSPAIVIDQFAINVIAILSGSLPSRFKEASYRHQLFKDPQSGSDGLFIIESTYGYSGKDMFGTGSSIRILTVNAAVSYWVSSDRRKAQRDGGGDMMRIGDLCENPANYNRSATGINFVRAIGFSRIQDLPRLKVWEARFEVEWQQGIA